MTAAGDDHDGAPYDADRLKAYPYELRGHAYDHDHPLSRPGEAGLIKLWPSCTYVDPLNVTADQVHPRDIAHALAHVCRFGGHVAVFYSVAEHSVAVARQAWRLTGDVEVTLAALLHDAPEAYLGDVPRPLKHSDAMAAYRAAEARAARAVTDRFLLVAGLDHPLVTELDQSVLAWEMAMFRDDTSRTARPHGEVCATFHAMYRALEAQRRLVDPPPAS